MRCYLRLKLWLIPAFLFNFLAAQNTYKDSLLKELTLAKHDSVKVNLLNELAFETYIENVNEAVGFAQQAVLISQKTNYLKGLGYSYNSLGNIYLYDNKSALAISNYLKALAAREKLKDQKGVATTLGNIGLAYHDKGDFVNAFDYQYRCLKVREETKDTAGLATTYNNIGNLFYEQANYEEALKFHFRSLDLRKKFNDKEGLVTSLNNIGAIYDAQKKIDTAISYHEKALHIEIEIDDLAGQAFSYNNIGGLYEQKNMNDRALEFYNKSLAIREQLQDKSGIASCYLNMGILYRKLKEFKKAQDYFDKAMKIAREGEIRPMLRDIYLNVSYLYSDQQKYKEAHQAYINYVTLKDSLFNIESNDRMASIRYQYEYDKKEAVAKLEQEKKDALNEKQKQKQRFLIIGISSGLVVLALLTILILRGYINKRKANSTLAEKNKIIVEKNKDITDSINAAQKIQRTLLAQEELLNTHLPQHFVFYQPKDIVSGDFYWATAGSDLSVRGSENALPQNSNSGLFYLAVCDSTGHGVPGAFMSLLNITFLNEAINEKNISEPNKIFNHVRKKLIESVSADGGKDGMDAILIRLEKGSDKLTFAAANNRPVLIRDNSIVELPADKMPVGKGEKEESFTLHETTIQKGDTLYLYTDGYADQFGGPKGKKFKYKALNELLKEISSLGMELQKQKLEEAFNLWKGNLEQVDDVCVIGIRF